MSLNIYELMSVNNQYNFVAEHDRPRTKDFHRKDSKDLYMKTSIFPFERWIFTIIYFEISGGGMR